MTKNSTWAALRNPAFRKLWIAAVISGTCVVAHDNAATWMVNIFTGSPLLLSLMSTVASLPFFLFTLPAGALADGVDRQKLVCTINVCMAATAFALALLGWLHLLNPYLILGGVFFIGVGFAINAPAWTSIVRQIGATQGKLRQDLTELDSDRKNAFIAAARSTEMPPHSLLVLVPAAFPISLNGQNRKFFGSVRIGKDSWALGSIRKGQFSSECARLIGSYRSSPCAAPYRGSPNSRVTRGHLG